MSYRIREEIRDVESRRAPLFEELRQLQDRQAALRDGHDDPGLTERVERINAGIAKLDERKRELEGEIEEREQCRAGLAAGLANGRPLIHTEAGTPFGDHVEQVEGVRAAAQYRTETTIAGRSPDQDAALRTIQRHSEGGELRSDAADTLDRLVRRDDPQGVDARYLAAVGSDAYSSAFGKMISDPNFGHLRFTPEEVAAVQRTTGVQAERALAIGSGPTGGFAIPFQLDPSIMLVSDGVLNPVRQMARVITIGAYQWRGVSSQGVTASYYTEGAEVADNSPTLAQPVITPAQGMAFVPFSMQTQDDWSILQQEMLKLIADARDVLDAQKFLTGTGVDEPGGVLTGLTTTQRVQTTGSGALALGDIYKLRGALPARFIARAGWAAHENTMDTIYRFVGGGSVEPPLLPTRDGPLLGRPKIEWSTMATTTATGSKLVIYGDWAAGFLVVDRIGMVAEIMPMLVGPNHRPTGQRGLLCRWRSGSAVVAPNAFRYLETL